MHRSPLSEAGTDDPLSSDEPFSLGGCVAVVTGATSGIGAAIVRRFVAAGAKVALTHQGLVRDEPLSVALIEELGAERVMAIVADASRRRKQ